MAPSYIEIGKQVYNLVDNNKDKINSFLSAKSFADKNDEKKELETWFNNNVKEQELNDLLMKGQNKKGLIDWISSEEGDKFFGINPYISDDNLDDENQVNTKNVDGLQKDIEDEDTDLYKISPKTSKKSKDSSLFNDLNNTNINTADDIENALEAIYGDGSDEDIDVTFDIVDMDGSDDIEIEVTPDDGSDEDVDDGSEDDEPKKEKKSTGRKKIHLDHHINKIVEKIDNDEVVDRSRHEKYYVAKREQLNSPAELDKLEEELDKQFVSYYDFPSVAIKIYESNEVKVNRIFEKLGFDFRCKDIAKYTRDWHADER